MPSSGSAWPTRRLMRRVSHADAAGSPVDPLVRRVEELDFPLLQLELIAAADEVNFEGLVLHDRLAVGPLVLLVAVGEAPDVDAELVGVGIDFLPDRDAEDGVVDAVLRARRNDAH